MKKLRKSFAIILSLALLLAFAVFPSAENDNLKLGVLSYEVVDGEILITDCEETADGEIVIPEEIDSIPVTCIGAMAFYHCRTIDSVSMPDTVTEIGERAFMGCYELKTIDVGENVVSIGNSAFDECAALESIELGDKVTYIGESAFNYCLKLTDITIPNGVESLYGTFSRCDSLKEITVPSSVSVVGYHTFSSCGALETVVFEEGVTELMDYAVVGCTSLKSVTLPSTLEKIGLSAFTDDTQLTDVYFNGTQEEWESIEIAEGNEPLLNATIHFAEDVRGDVNSDRFVNATDALVILRHAVRIDELTGQTLEKADVNADGFVNSSDALVVLRIAVGLENSEPETKEEIVEFYNTCVQKSSEQNKIVMEGFTDLSFTVNKFLVDGREDREVTDSYEDDLNAIEYDDVTFTFINGETEDGFKSEEVVLSAQIPLDEIDTATIEKHGDGYKITFTLYPSSYTLSEDELTGEFENYKSYSEENYGMEVLAVTDGEGRIVLLDLHYIQNVKATEIYEGIEFYMDIEADQRDIFTFAY